jgi:hypothetical protein
LILLFDLGKELKVGTVVWASWRTRGRIISWPSIIDKLTKDKKGKFKISIRYFERNKNGLLGNAFKMEFSKIESFFRSLDSHINAKKCGAIDPKISYDFFVAYTDALKTYWEKIDEHEKHIKEETTNKLGEVSTKQNSQNKHFVNDEWMTLDQIKTISQAALNSDSHLEEIKSRQIFSDKLIKILMSPDTKKHVKGIIDGSVTCEENDNYIKCDNSTRRKISELFTPGPLTVEHQKQLYSMVDELSRENFPDKPTHLVNYEYDILYTQAVLYGLMKLDPTLTIKKAKVKLEQGFVRTEEELLKQQCNQILNKLNISNIDEKEDENDDTTTNNGTVMNLLAFDSSNNDISM